MKIYRFLLIAGLFFSYAASGVEYIGVGVHPYTNSIPPNKMIMLLKDYKINSIRTDYYWDWAEKTKGVYQIPNQKTENLLIAANENNISTIIILNHSNKLYGAGLPKTKEQVEAFANFSAWVASKFKGRNYIFEIWNEWSRDKTDKGNKLSASEYFQLVKATSIKIKKINPDAKIIAGSFNLIGNDRSWGRQLVRLGVLDYVDGLSLHPYSFASAKDREPINNLNSINREIEVLQKISNHPKKILVYITEIGYPTRCNDSFLTESRVANYIKQYYNTADKFENIKGIWWYDFINDGNDCHNNEHNFGLLNNDLSPKKGVYSLKALNSN